MNINLKSNKNNMFKPRMDDKSVNETKGKGMNMYAEYGPQDPLDSVNTESRGSRDINPHGLNLLAEPAVDIVWHGRQI